MILDSKYNLIVILGPTAAGKTQLAACLAHQIQGEIISADSRQVYKGMNLGTGKDYEDYLVEGQEIKYHLIDTVEPGYKYNVFEYQSDFFDVFTTIQKSNVWPIMCGGSGLYIEAVLKGYKLINVPVNEGLRKELASKDLVELRSVLTNYKSVHNNSDTDTIPRAIRAIEIEEYYLTNPLEDNSLPVLNPLIIGVDIEREARRQRITTRLQQRLDSGLIQEAEQLLANGLSIEDMIYYGLEYKYLALYLTGKLSYKQMFDQLNVSIHQFAKRQMTWFRKMERDGFLIHWLNAFEPMDVRLDKIKHLLMQ